MYLTCDIALASVHCQFEKYGSGNLWENWQWKIDSYRIQDSMTKPVQIRIQNSFTILYPISNCKSQLLSEESSGFFRRQVFRKSDGETLWQIVRKRDEKVYLQYTIDPAYQLITLQYDGTQSAGNVAFEYLGLMIPYALLKYNILTFHGVLMEYDDRGIIISAPSGTGKTTHARFWRSGKRAVIINGDRATCQKVNGIWTGYGLPWSGTSGEQMNRCIPLTALVILERGEQNEAHLVDETESFNAVWPHVQYPNWDKKLINKALELTNGFLEQIPVIHLRCRPDMEAVEVLNQILEELSHDERKKLDFF